MRAMATAAAWERPKCHCRAGDQEQPQRQWARKRDTAEAEAPKNARVATTSVCPCDSAPRMGAAPLPLPQRPMQQPQPLDACGQRRCESHLCRCLTRFVPSPPLPLPRPLLTAPACGRRSRRFVRRWRPPRWHPWPAGSCGPRRPSRRGHHLAGAVTPRATGDRRAPSLDTLFFSHPHHATQTFSDH